MADRSLIVSAPRILVVGPAWVGDMVVAQALFATLKSRDSEIVVDVLAPPWSLPLLARMPQVRRAIPLPIGHGEMGLRKRWHIGKALRSEKYDQALVLPRSMKAALVPFFANIPRRTGYRGEFRYGVINDCRSLDKHVLTQTVQRFVALGCEPGSVLPPPIPQPALIVDRENQSRLLHELELSRARPVIAMMPGAEYGPAKRWPAAYYGELAARLAARGFDVWLLGSARDREVTDEVQRIAGNATVNLAGRTRLEDVIDLLALAKAAVTNDSGLMHVAAAVGTPLLAVYGSSTPDYTPPLTDRATVVYDRLPCSPCFKRSCPKRHTQCLTGIGPDRVWEVLESMLLEAA